jgi:tetratricopeptide (TPR) repeat protein
LAYVSLAQVYREQMKWDEAVKQLDEAVRLKPSEAFLYRLRALLYVQRPDPNLDMALKDTERAIAAEEERAGNSTMLASYYAEKGHILYLSHKYADAVSACDEAMKIDSKHANAYLWRAEAYLKLGKLENFQKAVDSFDEYQKKGGRQYLFDVYRDRGFAWAQCEKYFEAIANYTLALQVKPGDPFVLAARGWAHLAMQNYKEAQSDFDEAIRLQPDNADVYKGRGYARVKLGQYREAVADAEEAVRRGPRKSQLLYDAARIYAQALGKVQTAARPSKLARDYQDHAVQLLRQSLDLLPLKKRAQFWRNRVLSDSDLLPIHKSTEFLQLAAKYSQQGR